MSYTAICYNLQEIIAIGIDLFKFAVIYLGKLFSKFLKNMQPLLSILQIP